MNGFQKTTGWYKRLLLFCMLCSPALQEVYSMLWSETVFLILILLFIFSITNYLTFKTKRWLWISAGICAITCLTRYAEVFDVNCGTVLIFNKELNAQTSHGLSDIGILSVPCVDQYYCNYWLTGLATESDQK
jgi:hypothetical protein